MRSSPTGVSLFFHPGSARIAPEMFDDCVYMRDRCRLSIRRHETEVLEVFAHM